MLILVTGATGFIGSALVERLQHGGHALRVAVRDPAAALARWPGIDARAVDFASATRPDAWRPLLEGVGAVVNTVGIIREARGQTFRNLHVEAPVALFDAASAAGVERFIQVSALGADAGAVSAYHRSKREADEALASRHSHAVIVQPSLVFGAGGQSARLFLRMAAAPVQMLPGQGRQRVQPIHVDDLCDAIAGLIEVDRMPPRIAAVGPQCLELRQYLSLLRAALGAGRAWQLRVPVSLMRVIARIGDRFARMPIDSERLAMLERGNCADAGPIIALLGRSPRAASAFIPRPEAERLLREQRVQFATTWLRWSLALVWIVSGVVSLGLWPIEQSLAMLARVGLHGSLASVALYGAAALDIAFGIGTLVLAGAPLRRLYEAQMVLIAGYTLLIGMFLPELLLHPFAPIVKNLPMLAALVLLRWSERA
ncbi:MAG: NAD-dependent epimerase/dehydratase family protein [Lysobacteraceae bacterium]|nr:MAG: NAD-dependent epimerase/dehydratase family protein [Xanthomonadaceae bacterium]